MDGGHWGDIVKGNNAVILIDFLTGNLPGDDLVEDSAHEVEPFNIWFSAVRAASFVFHIEINRPL